MRFALSLLIISVLSAPAVAGKYNKVLSIGDQAPAWKHLPGVDGRKHSLADLSKKAVVVVVFTCNSCPYSVDYEKRLNALTSKYGGKSGPAAIVAINVNTVPADRLDKMQQRAREQKFRFAYLFDETQKIARKFGAIYTPEFYVLDKKRRVVYMGAMDDSTDASKVKRNYVAEAIEATIKNRTPEITETGARGCAVRFKRQRRRKPSQNKP